MSKTPEDFSFRGAIRTLLDYIGEEDDREGLLGTPERVRKAWGEWFCGYGQDPVDVLKTFEDGSEHYDELVIVSNIPVNSKCEHHIADIWGLAHVGYVPDKRIVGLSKIPRLVDIFARRLQVQERLTTQIADALNTTLSPKGVGVVLQCRHMCMESRGITVRGSITTTSSMQGCLRDQPAARSEFLRLVSEARNGTTI